MVQLPETKHMDAPAAPKHDNSATHGPTAAKATKGQKKPSIAKAPIHNDLAVRPGLSGHTAAAHDVHRHRRDAFHPEHAAPGLELSATPGLSFIQTDDAVFEFARVTDAGVDEAP